MASIKVSLICFLVLLLTLISFTSAQGPTNGTEVTITEEPEDTESAEVKGESESETETESESKSENENDDGKGEGTEKPEATEKDESEGEEKLSGKKEKEDEVDLEDDPIPEPRCLARYNNLNCTETQRQQAINNYKAIRGQLIQTLLSQSSGLTNSTNNVPTTTNSTSLLPSSNSTASATPSITLINSINSDKSSCNRANQLLANVDKYLRFNASCEARVFGKRNNPDYWISRCMRSLGRRH